MAQPDEPTARGYNEAEIVAAETEFDALIDAGIAAVVAPMVAAILAEPIPAMISDATLQPLFTLWNAYVAEKLTPALTRIFTGSAQMFVETARPALLALSYDLTDIAPINEPAAVWMAQASNRLRNVGNIVWEQIRDQLTEGIKAGDGIPELAARVREAAGFSEVRARATARTEVAAASNSGSITQARALGLDMDKQWEATVPTDGRTRPTHIAANHQTVPLGAPFVVGDSLLDFPGDPTGQAEEVINCRCSLGYLHIRRKEDSPTVAAGFVESQHPRDHSGKFAEHPGGGLAKAEHALSGVKALNSAPVQLTPDPRGHKGGHYEDAHLSGLEDPAATLALSEMEGLEYSVTNGYLRSRGARPKSVHTPEQIAQWEQDQREGDPEVEARIMAIDHAMDASPLPEDVVVHRGIKDGADTFGDAWYGEFNQGTFEEQDAKWPRWEAGERPDLTGMVWEEKAYSHTTVKDNVLDIYSRKLADMDPVAMTIFVPKGVKAIKMSGMDAEAELMLQRGLKFRVIADHGADSNGVRQWDVEVIPHD